MHTSSSLRLGRVGRVVAGLGLAVALVATLTAAARGQSAPDSGVGQTGAGAGHGRILLVLPFDNRTGQPSLEWIREAAPEILVSRFASAGFAPMSRADRLYALDHLGLPQGFHPSRATALKLAQTLDADSIVVGSYVTDGGGIVAEAQLVDVPQLRMSKAVTARGEMKNLIEVFDALAWELTRQLDPEFNVAEETFVAAGKGMRVDAFEQYIRGIAEPDHEERLRHLNQSVALSPAFSPAWMALGREDYNSQQYEQAAAAFARVGRDDPKLQGPDALEAGFFLGLSLVFSGDYPRAERAFAGIAQVLPLAEVVNNQGVAVSRQGNDGTALFRQAVAADPNVADYHFNLAVSLKRHGEVQEAAAELAACLRLKGNDSEAQELAAEGKTPAAKPVSATDSSSEEESRPDPLERIARNFNAVAFRQAAQMLDQVDEARLTALEPQQRAEKLAAQAKDFLDRGLLLEAERLYQTALASDDRVAAVHAGLAEIRERTGDRENARKEARTSLELLPSVQAYLVMGRLDLAAGHMEEAGYDVGEALKIEPGNQAAQRLQQRVESVRQKR
ncbi:MAG: tetratricopeptide repeat protein [Terracidiphilus sp.]|nr:tetratricopeptide repeat protein [Terracidiphilus sp.]